MAIPCGPKILFYGQLSNNVGSDNVSSVHHLRFAHPVYVSEVRVMGQRDLDEDARFWACKSFSAECESQPSRFKLEIYGLNLNQASQAVFQQIASIRYSGTNDGRGLSAEVSEDIPTDRLVFRGLYQKLTVAVIGVLARAASANPVDSFAELISANDSTLFDTFSHIVSLLPSPGPVVPTISLPQSRQLRPMPPPSSSAPGGFNKMARHYRPRLPNLNLLTGLSRVSAKIDVVPSGGRPESAESSCSESSGFDNSSEDDDEQVEDNSANSFELERGDLLGLILDRAQT